MPEAHLSQEVIAALNHKMRMDLDLLRLRQAMRQGEVPFSESALISALERCDEAMERVWTAWTPAAMPLKKRAGSG